VCYALEQAARKSYKGVPEHQVRVQSERLIGYIDECLGTCATVQGWLAANSSEYRTWVDSVRLQHLNSQDYIDEEILLYRLRWIDSMIQEFE
jgi:hypothetical protein